MLLVPLAHIFISTFIIRCELIVERSVHFCTCLSIACLSRTRSKITLSSSKNRHGSMWLEFITAPINIRLSNMASISRQTRDLSLPLAYSPMCTKRRSNCNFAPMNRAILVTANYLGPTTRRWRLAQQSSSSHSMHSSHRCSHAKHQSNDLTALLQQFAFYSFVVFLFRSHS